MNRFVKNTIVSVAVAATTLATMPMAQAGERWRHHNRRPVIVQQQPNDTGALVAAGILGLAVGALVVGATQSNAQPDRVYDNPYRHPRPRPVRDPFPPAPDTRYGSSYDRHAGFEPWSPGWYRWCAQNYRSFDPSSGTYTLRPGVQRFCVVQ